MQKCGLVAVQKISIHAPRAGSDRPSIIAQPLPKNFNPRSPCGERQTGKQAPALTLRFQSTLPVRGATQPVRLAPGSVRGISIHAPRAGSDVWTEACAALNELISIHAPRAGSDVGPEDASVPLDLFQSTLPVRGATMRSTGSPSPASNFNPRSPCGERPRQQKAPSRTGGISIHAPRAGSDRHPGPVIPAG